MSINKEGAEHSTFVIDANKIACPYCNGTQMMLSNLMDDPNDITEDTVFAALGLTITGGSFQGLVALCKQCGHTHVPLWYFFDTVTFTGAETTPALTNLDATVANGLADLFFITLVGTNAGKYVEIASNTVATPTVPTLKFAMPDDSDGLCMITNIEPVGLTKVVA